MKKQLFTAICIAIFIMAAFIFSVAITEAKNDGALRKQYASNIKTQNNSQVTIPAPTEQAFRYQKNKVVVWIIRLLLGMVVPFVFVFSGFSAGLRSYLQERMGRIILVIICYYIIYTAIDSLINLPLEFYSGFIRSHSYGLSNQALSKWLADWIKSFLLNTALGGAFVWVPFAIIKASPEKWWLYLGLISIPVLLFMSFLSPLYIEPIFNKYTPVKDIVLDSEIHAQLHRTTIGDCDVFQVDKSVDTNEMNAYMTGIFKTKRIVLWDTTINQLSHRETLAILAHEMGHYLMGHIWKSTVLGGLLSILIFWLVNKTSLWVIAMSGRTLGFNSLHDVAALPLLLLVLNIFMFIASPGINAYSRQIEGDADRFEVELTHDNVSAATAIVKLHQGSLALPRPGLIYTIWNYDHPTYEDRVSFLNEYKPWEENRPLIYQKYIVR